MIPFIKIDLSKIKMKHIMIVLFVLLIAYSSIQTMRVKSLKAEKEIIETERKQIVDLFNEKNLEVQRYVNAYNNEVAHVQAMNLSHANAIRLKDSKYLEILKQFEGLRKDYKNLVATASFDMSMFGNEVAVPEPRIVKIPCTDTLKAFNYRILDEYNDIEILTIEPPKKLDIRIPLDLVLNWKREKKFLFIKYGPKKWEMQAFTPNKLVRIDSMRIVKIDKKE